MLDLVTIIIIVLAVLSVIELGLTGYVADVLVDAPSEVAFLVFASVWSLVLLAYLAVTPRFAPQFFHKLAALGLLAVTVIFWFAGSIAAAAFLGAPRCRRNRVCRSFQAGIAFGFFIWAGFTGLAILFGLDFKKNRNGPVEMTTQKPTTAQQPYAGV